MDFFSELPEHLLQDIVSFLPSKAAAQTSVLSKSWKSAWDSRCSLDFFLFQFRHEGLFEEFMAKTLERHILRGHGVEKLVINCKPFEQLRTLASIKHWIEYAFAAGNSLKHLELNASIGIPNGAFFLRQKFFPLAFRPSTTLTTLKLCNCMFEGILSENIKFPNLKYLNLIDIPISSDIFHTGFLSGSPLLESLHLTSCEQITSVHLLGRVSPFLNSVFIEFCSGIKIIEILGVVRMTRISIRNSSSLGKVHIQAPNLQYFCFGGYSRILRHEDDIKLGDCDWSLKSLQLERFVLSESQNWLQTMVSRFFSLQRLSLIGLRNSKKDSLRISSPCLRELEIVSCRSFSEETVINAPGLRSVCFVYNKYPLYSLPASNDLSMVEFTCCLFENQGVSTLWLHNMEILKANTNHFAGMKMSVFHGDKGILIFHRNFSYFLLINIINMFRDLASHDPIYRLEFAIYPSSFSGECMKEPPFGGKIMTCISFEAVFMVSSSVGDDDEICKDFLEWARVWGNPWYVRKQNKEGYFWAGYELEEVRFEEESISKDLEEHSVAIDALVEVYRECSCKLARINCELS